MDRRDKIRRLAEQGATEGERTAAREALKRIDADKPDIDSLSILPQTDEEILECLTNPQALKDRWQLALERDRLWEYDMLYQAIVRAGR